MYTIKRENLLIYIYTYIGRYDQVEITGVEFKPTSEG